MPLLDVYDPRNLANGSTSEGPQGFGAAEAISLLLPIVFAFFQKALDGAAGEAGKDAYQLIAHWVKAGLPKADPKVSATIRTALQTEGLNENLESVTDAVEAAIQARTPRPGS